MNHIFIFNVLFEVLFKGKKIVRWASGHWRLNHFIDVDAVSQLNKTVHNTIYSSGTDGNRVIKWNNFQYITFCLITKKQTKKANYEQRQIAR